MQITYFNGDCNLLINRYILWYFTRFSIFVRLRIRFCGLEVTMLGVEEWLIEIRNECWNDPHTKTVFFCYDLLKILNNGETLPSDQLVYAISQNFTNPLSSPNLPLNVCFFIRKCWWWQFLKFWVNLNKFL